MHGGGPGIPRIDLSPVLDEGLDSPVGAAVAEQVRVASCEIGFMSVTGHGVPPALIEEMVSAAHAFFALPLASKLAVAPKQWNPNSPNRYRGYFPSSAQGKEGLDLGDPRLGAGCEELLARPYYECNRVPEALDASWSECVARYFDAQFVLGRTLLETMTAALGGDPTRVEKSFTRPRSMSTLRCNFYPRLEAPVGSSREDGAALSCETHVDSGLLTVLYQDQAGRLQVRDRQRCWHDVQYDPTAFVVNTGLAFERLSGRVFRATRHRVLFSGDERVSIPFFFEPEYDFPLTPEALGIPVEPQGEAIPYERFLLNSLSRFAEYDRNA